MEYKTDTNVRDKDNKTPCDLVDENSKIRKKLIVQSLDEN